MKLLNEVRWWARCAVYAVDALYRMVRDRHQGEAT